MICFVYLDKFIIYLQLTDMADSIVMSDDHRFATQSMITKKIPREADMTIRKGEYKHST